LTRLGHNTIAAGTKGASNMYPEILKRSAKISYERSQFVLSHDKLDHYELTESILKENFEFYKSSKDFNEADAVICSFTSSLCEAFIPLNKTIIFNPAHRYNIGRCTRKAWTQLNENYYKLKEKSKLVVSSNSRYDGEYQAHFTGLRGNRIYAYGTNLLLISFFKLFLFIFSILSDSEPKHCLGSRPPIEIILKTREIGHLVQI
jgi:hypothetical protein